MDTQRLHITATDKSPIGQLRALVMLVLGVLGALLTAKAQDELPTWRPVTTSYSIEFGRAHIADTYLTPLHYRGSHLAFEYERDQAMRFNPEHWTMQLKLGAIFESTENPAKNATMLSATFHGAWAMMRRWRLPYGFTLGAGPGVSLETGILYLSRNSNNPASAKAGFTLDLTGYASWNGQVWRLPVTLRYQPSIPLTGIFFSPDYGELYYQIYLGDHDGLMHAAWPGNYFIFDNLLTADLHLGRTSLRLGYHNRYFSSKVNHLTTIDVSNAIVIGITTEWVSLRPNRKTIEANIISAY